MRETFGAIQVLYIIIALAALVLHGFLAAYAGTIASDKGYTEARWGLLCFFLPVAYIVVGAMPDLRMREIQEESNDLLREILAAKTSTGKDKTAAKAGNDELSSLLPDL